MNVGRLRRSSLLLAILLGACSSTPATPSPAPSASASQPGISTFGRVFAQVRDDGTVSLETALEAFSLAIAPLPGVALPTGDPPALYERMSGTFAIDWILPYRDQLTPEQKAVVDRVLAPDPAAIELTGRASGGTVMAAFHAASAADQPFLLALGEARTEISQQLGRSLNLPVHFVLNTSHLLQPNVLAYTAPIFGQNGLVSGCEIRAEPELATLNDVDVLRATMAHEIFHCFQTDLVVKHGLDISKAYPSWLVEGEAEWVGEATFKPSSVGLGWWENYLKTVGTGLFARTYDAVGFYEHMAEMKINPWTHFDAMLLAGSNPAAYLAGEADQNQFLETWAPGLARKPGLGDPWNVQGRWVTSVGQPPTEMLLDNGQFAPIGAGPVANFDAHLAPAADIVEIRIPGHARLHAGSVEDIGLQERFLCTKAGGCACPAGTHASGPDLETVPKDITIAVTGGLEGNAGILLGHPASTYCAPDASTPAGGTGGGLCAGCGGSNGDPHLWTVNGWHYDLQAAGEFVLLRGADGTVEIQARSEPALTGKKGVALNTAVAARVNGHRVAVYAGSSGLQLRVDGTAVDPSGVDLGQGAQLSAYPKGYQLSFPDGTTLWMLSVGTWGINAIVRPSDTLRQSGRGLLASIRQTIAGAPAGLGVPALPDGSTLPAASSSHEHYLALYGRFAPAWQVTAQTSLFDYNPGTSAETYIKPGFPAEADVVTIGQLDPNQVQQATTACAGVTDYDLLQDCVYDVAVTGATEYVSLYNLTDTFQRQGTTALGPEPSVQPSSSPAAGSNPACQLLTAGELESILGASSAVIAEASQPDDPGTIPGFSLCEWKVFAAGSATPGLVKVRLGTGTAIAVMQQATGQLQPFPQGAALVPGARYDGSSTVIATVRGSYVEVTVAGLSFSVDATLAALIQAAAARM